MIVFHVMVLTSFTVLYFHHCKKKKNNKNLRVWKGLLEITYSNHLIKFVCLISKLAQSLYSGH